MARRTKLTPQVQALFIQALEMSMTIDLASKYAGITNSTFITGWIAESVKARGFILNFWKL